MANPAANILRWWRYNIFGRRLTIAVLGICTAVLYTLGTPIKAVLCNADLPKAQFAFKFTGFQTAQSIICSEKDMLPTPNAWNLSYHQGGNGPWIPKVDGVIHDELTLPAGCVIDQVHMVSLRNASRGVNYLLRRTSRFFSDYIFINYSWHASGLECCNADCE